MDSVRRQFLGLGATAAMTVLSLPSNAWPQIYPSRPVRVISAFPAGGPNDILARLIGQGLSERFGQPFVIENRSGAAGNIGTEAVVRTPADGYTLLLIGPTNTINATFYPKLSFDFLRDIAPVASISRETSVIVVHPSFPANSISEFIAYAKLNRGKINMASAGNGSASHASGELFKMMTGIDLVHVPYRGGAPALTDLIGAHVQVFFAPLASSMEYIKAGKLRALAVTAATRSEALPDIPALDEYVPGYQASSVYGLGAPRNTPAEVVDKLNMAVNAVLADPKTKERLADFGSVPWAMTPTEFGRLLASETDKWAKVVKFAGMKPE
jgi:tripartite-type tricarboxylate transporter receptor subunit TctC